MSTRCTAIRRMTTGETSALNDKKLIAFSVSLLAFEVPASAHRLDEYLQAILIAVEKDQVQASMRLVPGVAVFPVVLAGIDTNSDGVISKSEQQEYALRVLRDLSLSIDGASLSPRLVSVNFPTVEAMEEGLGEIQIKFSADLPAGGSHRKLVIQDHHQSRISAYLVNCLVPRDPDIRVTGQNRNVDQSFYELDYAQANRRPDLPSLHRWWSGSQVCPKAALGFRVSSVLAFATSPKVQTISCSYWLCFFPRPSWSSVVAGPISLVCAAASCRY